MNKNGASERVRSRLSWAGASVWAALITVMLFSALNWHGCLCFRQEPRDLLFFVYVFTWMLVFFAVRMRWRIILSIVTLIVLIPVVGTRFGMAEMNAAPESAAVHALQQLRSNLKNFEVDHQQQGYPDTLPAMTLSHWAQRFYRFEYIPSRGADGKIRSYLIEAIPARRECGPNRSFTITSDNRIFWTLEPRAATPTDTLLLE